MNTIEPIFVSADEAVSHISSQCHHFHTEGPAPYSVPANEGIFAVICLANPSVPCGDLIPLDRQAFERFGLHYPNFSI